jgi:hypothetical protein
MKAIAVVLVLGLTCSGFAKFDVGCTETFDKNLDGWQKTNDVCWTNLESNGHGGYACMGSLLKNNNDSLSNCIVAPCSGYYCVKFDYRFTGCDIIPSKDDKVCVQIDCKNDSTNIFTATSSKDLTGGLLCPGKWRCVQTDSSTIHLQSGKKYTLDFELKCATGCLTPITFFDVDNISICKEKPCPVSSVPAPGAIVLGVIGSSLVGYYRRKRVL